MCLKSRKEESKPNTMDILTQRMQLIRRYSLRTVASSSCQTQAEKTATALLSGPPFYKTGTSAFAHRLS